MVHVTRCADKLRAKPRFLLASALMAASLIFAPATFAEEPVSVGEVSTVAGAEDAATTLRTALTTELAKVKAPSGKKFIVSASLVKLETKTSGSDATTSCVVSLAIRDAKDGAIRGVVNGTSQVVAKDGDRTAKSSSVEAAVRGATKNLPVVLAKN